MGAVDCRIFVCATISMPLFAIKLRKMAGSPGFPIVPVRSGAPAALDHSVGGVVLIEGTDRFVASKAHISRRHAVVLFDTPIIAHELAADLTPVDYDMVDGDAWSMSKASPSFVAKSFSQVISYVRSNGNTLGTYDDVDRTAASRLLMVINMAAEGSGNLVKALSAITHSLQPAEREQVRAALRHYLGGSVTESKVALQTIAKLGSNRTVGDSVKQMTDVLRAEGDKYRVIVSPKASPTDKRKATKSLGLSQFEVRFLETLLKGK